MISLQISDTKNFMKHLLLSDTFDHFLTVEGAVTTYNTFSIDGHLRNDYYTEEELAEQNLTGCSYSYWQQLKPFFLSIIKGKRTPQNFKIIFQLSPKNTEKLLQSSGVSLSLGDVTGLYLNLTFDGKNLSCITGTSLNIFTMDKSLDHAWDELMQKFFKKKEIFFEN